MGWIYLAYEFTILVTQTDAWRNKNVTVMPKRRFDVIKTLLLRHVSAG